MNRIKLFGVTALLCLLMVFPSFAYTYDSVDENGNRIPSVFVPGDYDDYIIFSYTDKGGVGAGSLLGNFDYAYFDTVNGNRALCFHFSYDYWSNFKKENYYRANFLSNGTSVGDPYAHILEAIISGGGHSSNGSVVVKKLSNGDGYIDKGNFDYYIDSVLNSTVKIYKDSTLTEVIHESDVEPETSDILYNSDIPAPQNLQFKASAEGGIPIVHIGGKNYHTLTWTNADVAEYGVRISAVIVATDDQQNSVEKEIMVCSDGSDGSSTGYRASNKFFKYNFTDFWDTVAEETGYGLHMESLNLKQYRVQFYQYVSGVQHVGPVGVIGVKRNAFGAYSGNSVTTEFPLNTEDVGSSGGLYDSDSGSKWTSEGQPYVDYDASGNQVATGTVGKGEDISGNGNPLSTIQDIISGLVNIPTVISQFFNSLKDMMGGIGELPSLIGQLFSFLPAGVIAVIGLVITIAIVLRILGR